MQLGDYILYIYSSVYNNSNTVDRSIKSLEPLMPYKMFVVDNYSNDGTYEKLKKYEQIVTVQRRCTLGRGRDLAMNMALKEATPNDPMFLVDLDNVFTDLVITDIKMKMKRLKNDTFYWVGCLGKASTHAKVPWNDLIFGEEMEHGAHAISLGIETHYLDIKTFYTYIEDIGGSPKLSVAERQFRYAHGFMRKMVRLYRCLIDAERAYAFKSPYDFIKNSLAKTSDDNPRSTSSLKKGIFYLVAYYIAYTSAFVIAKLLGVYSYDKKLNNQDYVTNSNLYKKEKMDV